MTVTLTPERGGRCEVDRPVGGPPIVRACPKRARWMTSTGHLVCGEHARAIRGGASPRFL